MAGWGLKSNYEKTNTLQQVDVPYVDNTQCLKNHPNKTNDQVLLKLRVFTPT